jgi:hypothetical protein
LGASQSGKKSVVRPSPTLERTRPEAQQAKRAAEHGSEVFSRVALAARSIFYLVLAGITASLAAQHWSGQQANSNGALALLTRSLAGKVAVAIAALAFAVLGITRLVVAIRGGQRRSAGNRSSARSEGNGVDLRTDTRSRPPAGQRSGHSRDKSDTKGRLLAGVQGIFYLAMAYVPASFLNGKHNQGTEQQQHATTARLLRLPGGRELVIAIGLIVIGVCVYQIHNAVTEGYTKRLRLEGTSPRVRRFVELTGKVGIAARALVFLPIGIFLIVAAIQFDPNHAKGIDGELAGLAQHAWGRAVLALIAAGLVVFAVYSMCEAKYRDIEST